MGTRRKARETALKILYKADISESIEIDYSGEMEELHPGTEARSYCEALVRGVLGGMAGIDGLIEGSSENWAISRMPIVDRNILRIAVYELLYCPSTPYKVVIDEAVELAKRYGAGESGAFVNGVLDKVHRELEKRAANAG